MTSLWLWCYFLSISLQHFTVVNHTCNVLEMLVINNYKNVISHNFIWDMDIKSRYPRWVPHIPVGSNRTETHILFLDSEWSLSGTKIRTFLYDVSFPAGSFGSSDIAALLIRLRFNKKSIITLTAKRLNETNSIVTCNTHAVRQFFPLQG